MAKLTGWEPKRRERNKSIHAIPAHILDADEFFSFTTFDTGAELTTRGKLVTRFYEWNNNEGGMKPWITMKLDPQEGAIRHIWYWGHYKDYHVISEQSYLGPHRIHRARLFYRQSAGSVLWLASAQLGPLYFYSQEKVMLAYLEVLAFKKFYISPEQLDKVVAM